MPHAVTLSGSIRSGSQNRLLQDFVGQSLKAAGFEVTAVHLGDYDLPLYNQDLEPDHVPADAEKLADLLRSADIIFVATPEYNGTLPPVLINAITWVSRQKPSVFAGRVWGIGGVSSGKYGAISALSHLRDSLSKMGAVVAPGLLGLGPARDLFDASGAMIDKSGIRKVDQLVAAFKTIKLT